MRRAPFSEARHGLQALLGVVATDPRVLGALGGIDASLRSFAAELDRDFAGGWRCDGLTVDEFPGPPEPARKFRLSGYVESTEVTFLIELTRGDFYENYGALGRSPDAFYAEAEVYIDSDRPGGGRDDTALELPVREAARPDAALVALAEQLTALRREAGRRPPTATAWRSRD